MSDVEITLKLPEDLIRRARAFGIEVEALFIAMLETQIRQKEAERKKSS